jgi:hypothetical protein
MGQQVFRKRWRARVVLYSVIKKASFQVLKLASKPLGWDETDVFTYRVASRVVGWNFSCLILDVGTIWRLCGSFTFKPLYPRRRANGVYSIGSWMGPTAHFDAVEKRGICDLSVNPLTPELNTSAQRCLTKFFTGDLLLETCISLIYAWKTNKYTNYSLSLWIMYGAHAPRH